MTLTREASNGIRALTAAELTRLNEKTQDLRRSMDVGAIDIDARTVELAFSSEIEAPRWFGIEILDHGQASVRLGRLNDGGALLMDHNWTDQVGVILSASIDADRRGRATVRFSRSKRAEEVFQDVVDKIRRHVSVGYRILAAVLLEVRADGTEVYLVTDWEPYEISFVAVPMDPTVGVGRSAEITQEDPKPTAGNSGQVRAAEPIIITGTNERMKKKFRKPSGELVLQTLDDQGNLVSEEVVQTAEEYRQERAAGGAAERERVNVLNEMGTRFANATPDAAELARAAVANGDTPEQLQNAILQSIERRAARPLTEQVREGSRLNLDDRDAGAFSFLRAIRALANPSDRTLQRAAGHEFEVSRAYAETQGRSAQGILIPPEVLVRTLTSSTGGGAAGTGGYGIQTTLMTQSFVDLLRKKNTIMRNGFVMGGLNGNVDIPRKVSGMSGYWVGEDEDAIESQFELDQISLSPKTVAGFTDLTRRLLQQDSLGVEAMARVELALGMADAIDYAGYYGIGSAKQPLGLFNYDGLAQIELDGDYPTYAEYVAMETEIAAEDADVEAMRYVMNARARGNAKTTQKFPGTNGAPVWEPGNTVNGYGTEVTNRIQDGDVALGNFNDFLVGLWGGLDLTVDTAAKAKSGGLRIIGFQDVDFTLRRLQSFATARRKA